MSDARSIALAYLAGIVDGEGHIGIERKSADAPYLRQENLVSPRYVGAMVIVNTSHVLMEWLTSEFGGTISNRKAPYPHYKPTMMWRLSSRATIALLRELLPYLKIKRVQGQLLLAFLEELAGFQHRVGKCMSDEELTRREELFQAMKTANDVRRGRGKTRVA